MRTEPTGSPLGVTSEGKGGGRNNVKCFANARTSMGNSLDERLRHVIGVNVMERLHANIRQGDLLVGDRLPPAGNSGVTVRRSPIPARFGVLLQNSAVDGP